MAAVTLPILLAANFIQLAGPDGQRIEVNPELVVTVREPRDIAEDHFDPSIKCILQTADGKLVAVVTDCATVRTKLGERGSRDPFR